jgi:hypothetical protein
MGPSLLLLLLARATPVVKVKARSTGISRVEVANERKGEFDVCVCVRVCV